MPGRRGATLALLAPQPTPYDGAGISVSFAPNGASVAASTSRFPALFELLSTPRIGVAKGWDHMSQRVSALFATATVVASFVCGAGAANAQDRLIDEVRVGVLDHDTDLVGTSKEEGVDFGLEALSPPISQLSFLGSPRVVAGLLVNSEGQTNQIYLGLLAQKNIAEGVFRPNDAFFLEGMVGGALHDGERDVTGTPEEDEWKSHGSDLVFRTGFGFGYRFNERWSLTATFAHISNADLAEPNEGANDVGLRLGVRL
jgi:lipid A 3-O-deacylase